MAALQRVAQSSVSTTASSYGSCKGGATSSFSAANEMAVSDRFPAGLRVLVVDDDTTCLRILEVLLGRCAYQGMSLIFFFLNDGLYFRCLMGFLPSVVRCYELIFL